MISWALIFAINSLTLEVCKHEYFQLFARKIGNCSHVCDWQPMELRKIHWFEKAIHCKHLRYFIILICCYYYCFGIMDFGWKLENYNLLLFWFEMVKIISVYTWPFSSLFTDNCISTHSPLTICYKLSHHETVPKRFHQHDQIVNYKAMQSRYWWEWERWG
jgi:hypothetical protein